MNLAKVIGTIWATRKNEQLKGLKMQLIQPVTEQYRNTGAPLVAVDTVGAGVGEWVYYVTAFEAVIPLNNKPALVDAAIVGIIDRVEL